MPRLVVVLAMGLLALVLATQAAFADRRCPQVQLNISNQTGQTIRVFRLRYYDTEDGQMRTNNISNTDIPDGYAGSMRETLEHVGGEPIGWVSVQYRVGTSGQRQWSEPAASGIDDCVRSIYLNHTIAGPAN